MEAPPFLFLQQKTSSRLSSLTVLSMPAFITAGINIIALVDNTGTQVVSYFYDALENH